MAGIYIHIPFCKAKCRYCDFTSYPSKLGFADAYMACVLQEMRLRAPALQGKTFSSVYFGGGTPSVIDAKWIVGCMNRIRECMALDEKAEVTVELNPGTVDADKIAAYKHAGVNRFSIGLQAAQDAHLSELGRVHTAADYLRTCELIGDANKSADIMIGLKGQTCEDVRESIDFALRGGVSHISMYALTPEDGTPIYSDYLNGDLPDGDDVAQMYDCGCETLQARGLLRYEVSNFAKPGFESVHNRNYWRRGEYIGFGVAASSFFFDRRFTNTRDLDDYMKCILSGFFPVVDDAEIGQEDARFERVMLALRTAEGLNLFDYKREFGTDFASDFFEPLKKHADRLEMKGGRIRIKPQYLFVQNSIISDFLE